MLAGELHGKVGVAPGTTTLYIPSLGQNEIEIPVLTEDQYRAADIAVRKKEAAIRSREVFWTGFAAFGTSAISSLVLLGILASFLRTGKLKTPKAS